MGACNEDANNFGHDVNLAGASTFCLVKLLLLLQANLNVCETTSVCDLESPCGHGGWG